MRPDLSRTISIAAGIALGGLTLTLGGRLISPAAHADLAAGARPSIAVCATPTLINELMQSDRFLPAREEAAADLRNQLREITEEMQEIRDELQGSDPDSPESRRRFGRFRELTSKASQIQQEIAVTTERKFASQLVECFELVKASADAIADDLGYEYVISTGSPDEQLSRDQSDATLRQITARPMIKYPRAADITDDVRDDLNLD